MSAPGSSATGCWPSGAGKPERSSTRAPCRGTSTGRSTSSASPWARSRCQDLAGLDIGWVKEQSRGGSIRDRLCELDRRGQKTGAGYYDYDAKRNGSPSPVTEAIVREFAERSGRQARSFTQEEIVERLIYPMINEGAKILEEGKAIRASDIDIIWINGYNWPAYRGGPMFYADQVGLDQVLARLQELTATAGPQWTPAPLLERLVAEGKRLSEVRATTGVAAR